MIGLTTKRKAESSLKCIVNIAEVDQTLSIAAPKLSDILTLIIAKSRLAVSRIIERHLLPQCDDAVEQHTVSSRDSHTV